MPTKRTYRLKGRKTGNRLTPSAKVYFFYGLDLGDFNNEAEARAAWQQHRERLLHEWISADPGTRCWAWWEWERPHGQLRRQLAGPEPLPDSPIHRGRPSWWPCKNLLFEVEVEFLHRNHLLTREEESRHPELKQRQRSELKAEALRHSAPPLVGSLELPTERYTSEQVDAIFKQIDEIDETS